MSDKKKLAEHSRKLKALIKSTPKPIAGPVSTNSKYGLTIKGR